LLQKNLRKIKMRRLIGMRLIRKHIWVFVLVMATPVYVRAQTQAPPVDQASADRGEQVFTQTCAQCHGADARGTAKGPDLIRSLIVLHDRMQQLHGSEMATVLKKSPDHSFDLTQAQVADISQFLTRAINRILRSGYSNTPTNMLSGDSKAGEAFFNGAGGCNKCHSPTGDLAGIATKYDPAALQQRFVFPNSGRGGRGRGAVAAGGSQPAATSVTVTPPSGRPVTGTLVRIDDFNVSLVDAAGEDHTWTRVPGMKVAVVDPYAAHIALLDKYTDADMHNVTAYLETLK
jgi:cytochrome c oxidase cbb3-type subunit III